MDQTQTKKIEDNIILAALKIIARHGLASATLEAVAKDARVDPVDLKRRYPSLKQLARHVTWNLLNQLDTTVPEPCGDLEEDLKKFASDYREFWQRYPGVLAYNWEAAKDSELLSTILEKQCKTRAKIVAFFAFYRQKGCFIKELDELNDEELEHELVGVFLGTIFARVNWESIGIVKARFNLDRHVRCFLKGYGHPQSS